MGMIEERDELWAKWRANLATDFGGDVDAAWLAAQADGEDAEIGSLWSESGEIQTYWITPEGYPYSR